MTFIQTISFSSDRMEEMQELMDRFRQAQTQPSPGLVRVSVAKDRDDEGRYMVIAEFDSYEVAMENSARPETDAFAKEMATLTSGQPTFGNYDLIRVDVG